MLLFIHVIWVFICKFATAISDKLILKLIIIFVFLFNVNSLRWQNRYVSRKQSKKIYSCQLRRNIAPSYGFAVYSCSYTEMVSNLWNVSVIKKSQHKIKNIMPLKVLQRFLFTLYDTSKNSFVRGAHSFVFLMHPNMWIKIGRGRFPWINLYLIN